MIKICDIIEEIALEGSFGITIECLFARLNQIENSEVELNFEIKCQIWSILRRDRELRFFELEFDRFLPQFPIRQSSSGSDQLRVSKN